MATKTRHEFRFSVGKPNQRRSTVWKVFSNKNDIYICSRMMGPDMKISLHETGKYQWSMTSAWVAINLAIK